MSLAQKAEADKDLRMGGNGTVITAEDGSIFQYNSSFGGYWSSTPFDNSARVRSDVPALNESWDWSNDLINGVNLGGWLNLEPFITPALFEPFNGEAVDEYTLSALVGDNLTAFMTDHYETFITEIDFARIAEAGLNWIRLPIPYWFIETYEDEPFLEGVGWTYFLKGIAWARKYGLRIELDLHAVPGSQNGQNHSGRIGTVGFERHHGRREWSTSNQLYPNSGPIRFSTGISKCRLPVSSYQRTLCYNVRRASTSSILSRGI